MKEETSMKICLTCGARLLGMSYIVAHLDDGRSIPLCRFCWRKVQKLQRQKGLPVTVARS